MSRKNVANSISHGRNEYLSIEKNGKERETYPFFKAINYFGVQGYINVNRSLMIEMCIEGWSQRTNRRLGRKVCQFRHTLKSIG